MARSSSNTSPSYRIEIRIYSKSSSNAPGFHFPFALRNYLYCCVISASEVLLPIQQPFVTHRHSYRFYRLNSLTLSAPPCYAKKYRSPLYCNAAIICCGVFLLSVSCDNASQTAFYSNAFVLLIYSITAQAIEAHQSAFLRLIEIKIFEIAFRKIWRNAFPTMETNIACPSSEQLTSCKYDANNCDIYRFFSPAQKNQSEPSLQLMPFISHIVISIFNYMT